MRNGDRVRHENGTEGVYIGPIPRSDGGQESWAVAVELGVPNRQRIEWWFTSWTHEIEMADAVTGGAT